MNIASKEEIENIIFENIKKNENYYLEDIYFNFNSEKNFLVYQLLDLQNFRRHTFYVELNEKINDKFFVPSIRKKIISAGPLEEQLECMGVIQFTPTLQNSITFRKVIH